MGDLGQTPHFVKEGFCFIPPRRALPLHFPSWDRSRKAHHTFLGPLSCSGTSLLVFFEIILGARGLPQLHKVP